MPRRNPNRYRLIFVGKNHPLARGKQGLIAEHRLVVETALGKRLPSKVEIHHVNGDKLDNRPENLVVCPDIAYHRLLHVREEALRATGDPSRRRCLHCGQYDEVINLRERLGNRCFEHRKCANEARYLSRKAKEGHASISSPP